ncbi:MAG: glucokinase [Hyphomicrobiales bacterium]|nr:glucokinase [Paracoccaceae bacterium]PCJ91898.1 MAG: glucokinase [Hyphomicrobiales bacterium]
MSYPVLVADIGGTNARFGILTDAHADLKEFETAKTADFDGLEEAVGAKIFAKTGIMPRSAVLALAGPINGDEVPLTNCDWVIRPKELMESLNLNDVILVNDFEALALALPSLEDDDLQIIGSGKLTTSGTKIVVGPGTGLGAAGMVHADSMWVPVPGEGGHISLGPDTDDEFALWPHIEKEHGRISAEALLCGRGLVRLYRAVTAWKGAKAIYETPSEITSAALAGTDEHAVTSLNVFCRVLGRVAGDLAIIFMAKGGVYLAGGISQKIAGFLAQSEFREAFVAKAPHRHLMEEIGTAVIMHERPALKGLAAYARTPQRFGLELQGKRWRKNQ